MAQQAIYIPFYKDGAFHYVKVVGETGPQVPEGEPSFKSSATSTTPPKRLQPEPSHEQ